MNMMHSVQPCMVCFEEMKETTSSSGGGGAGGAGAAGGDDEAFEISPTCGHAFHRGCWRGHCGAKIMAGGAKAVPCILPSCKVVLDSAFVRGLFDPDSREGRIFEKVRLPPRESVCAACVCNVCVRTRKCICAHWRETEIVTEAERKMEDFPSALIWRTFRRH